MPAAGPVNGLERLIRSRRMTRSFTSESIGYELLDALLDVARRAPSAGFSQGVHFLALSGAATSTFWDVTGSGEWFSADHPNLLNAAAIVLPLADSAAYTTRYAEQDKLGAGLAEAANWPVPYWLTDAAMATQQLLLLAEEAGLGALFFGIFRNEALLLENLGVPAGITAIGAVALGYRSADDVPSGSPQTRTRAAASRVIHHDHW